MLAKGKWLVFTLVTGAALLILACAPAARPPGEGAPALGEETLKPPPPNIAEDDPRAMAGNKWLLSLTEDQVSKLTAEELRQWFPPRPQLGCPAKVAKRGGTYRFGTNWDPPHLDPTFTQTGGLMQLSTVNYDTLLEMNHGCKADDRKYVIQPSLAESWEISPDGKVYTFKIRKGVHWINKPPVNGRELTAHDIKWTYEHYYNTKGSVNKGDYEVVDKIEVPDPYTLKIYLKEPAYYFLTRVAFRYALILPKEIFEKDGDFKKTMVGSGPVFLEELKPKEYAYLKRNPNFWEMGVDGKPKPYLDDYYIYFMPDEATQLAAFRAKQVDIIQSGPAGVKGYQAVVKTNPDIMLSTGYGTGVSTFSINMRMDKEALPFKDVRVRRAISMAINRENIVKTVDEGRGACGGPIPWEFFMERQPTCADFGPWYQYNVEGAKKLLAEAGYPNGFDFTMTFYRYSSANQQTLEIVQQSLKQVGINMKIQEEDYSVYNNKLLAGDYVEATNGWSQQGIDPDTFTYVQVHSKSPGNRAHIRDAKLDALAEGARREVNDAKRRQIFKQIWDYELDQVYRIFFTTSTGSVGSMRQGYVRNLSIRPSLTPAYGGVQVKDTWLDK